MHGVIQCKTIPNEKSETKMFEKDYVVVFILHSFQCKKKLRNSDYLQKQFCLLMLFFKC